MTPPVGPARRFDVLADCRRVAAGAGLVRLDLEAADRLAAELAGEPPPPRWGAPHLVAAEAGTEAAAAWTLTLSAMNFCFWGEEPRWRVAGHDGYLGLAHALRRAHDAGLGPADPRRVAAWTPDDLAAVLAGDPGGAPLPPMLAERHAVAAELAGWLLSAWDGSASAALGAAPDAQAFAQTLAATLPRFRDVGEWHGRAVALLKRAQIAAHDCGAALGRAAPAGLRDRSRLTAFADYKLPQVLRHHGVIVYAAPLAARVDARSRLEAGSAEEVEIRALTVVAVHHLAGAMRRRGAAVDDCDVDARLWWRGQRAAGMAPYHRIRTIWY